MLKLNVVLAKRKSSESRFKQMLKDYLHFFLKNEKSFKGVRKIYAPRDGMMDDASKRAHENVVTTVDEKFEWFEKEAEEAIDHMLSVEATNASGTVKAPLVVDGVTLGEFSSMELLKLVTLLQNGDLVNMYNSVPVRSDAEEWERSTTSGFDREGIFSQKKQSGVAKSIQKKNIILTDPHPDAKRPPILGQVDEIIELGDWESQFFSGQWSQRQRAELLARRSKLLEAAISALEVANGAEIIHSKLTGKTIFDYLHRGKLPSETK